MSVLRAFLITNAFAAEQLQKINSHKNVTYDDMKWYRNLTFNQRASLKEMCVNICGIEWYDFPKLGFSPKERLQLITEKLRIEGFEI